MKRGERTWMKEGVEADWSFAQPDVLDMIHDRIRLRCMPYELADPGDMEQEFLLWLATRPDQAVSIAFIKAGADRFVQNAMRNRARDNRETSLDAMRENEEN